MHNNQTGSPVISLSPDLIAHLKNEEVMLQAGPSSILARVRDDTDCTAVENRICLSMQAARKLGINKGCFFGYLGDKNTLRLGPVVGIMTSSKKDHNRYLKGKKARLFKELTTYALSQGVFIYYFYPEGVDWKRSTISGYSCNADGKWVSGTFCLPDIVYNRILSRRIESQKHVKAVIEKFNRHPEIYFFNTRFLNKWEVYQALQQDSFGALVVPDYSNLNRTNLKQFLSRYPEVFLKPRNSSRGQGIIKITSDQGAFHMAQAESSHPKWLTFTSFNGLYSRLLQMRISEKKYLIQEGVQLASYNGRIFDLRTQVQKDGRGRWILTGVAVRVAGKNRFVTHIPNGGSAASYVDVMQQIFDSHARKSIDEQLNNISLTVPNILVEKLGLNLDILSMDIGVDNENRLWIIEVNSKPGSFDEDDIRKRHIQNLVEYCIFVLRQKVFGE